MINFIDKGYWLHDEIANKGYWLHQKNGVWESSDDVAVQAIIDSFDPLPYAKSEAITRVKIEGAKRASAIYPFIEADSEQAVGLYEMLRDLYLSIIPASREPLSSGLLDFKSVYDATIAASVDINAMTDWKLITQYDEVNTPLWP